MVTAQIYYENQQSYLNAFGSWRSRQGNGDISQKGFYEYMKKREKQGMFKSRNKEERPLGHLERNVLIIDENHRHLWPNPHYNVRKRPFPETARFQFERRWSRSLQPQQEEIEAVAPVQNQGPAAPSA
jgi:hypothetical protein